MRFTTLAVCVVVAASMLVGCKGGSKISDKHIRELEWPAVREALGGGEGKVVLVDARAPQQFEQGHVPGAINLFLPDVKSGDGRLRAADRIIVYGGGWQDNLAPATAKRLMTLKYADVYLFRGGMEAWQREQERAEGAAEAVDGGE